MEGNIRLNQAIAADNAVDASTCQWGDGMGLSACRDARG